VRPTFGFDTVKKSDFRSLGKFSGADILGVTMFVLLYSVALLLVMVAMG